MTQEAYRKPQSWILVVHHFSTAMLIFGAENVYNLTRYVHYRNFFYPCHPNSGNVESKLCNLYMLALYVLNSIAFERSNDKEVDGCYAFGPIIVC